MEKKKLIINSATCDTRNVSEETLDSYENISINAATILVSQDSKYLMAKYNVTMNAAEVIEVPKEAEIVVQNGTYDITNSTLFSKPVVLIVNGTLNIDTKSQEILDKFILIQVNGLVSYPYDIVDKLPLLKVNGTIDSYPGDAIRLKNKLVMDKTFILRAKNKKYYVKNKVVISDKDLDLSILNNERVKFITEKAIILDSILEEALPLFDEQVEINIIPDGLTYTDGGVLDDTLIRKYGDKLYVDGDLVINIESEKALNMLTRLKVEGTVYVNYKLVEEFYNINPEYGHLEITKGVTIGDRAFLTIDKDLLDKNIEGVRVFDCGVVTIKNNIDQDIIQKKLEFIDCGIINCGKDQKSSVEMVSKGVGLIIDSQNDIIGNMKDLLGNIGLSDDEMDRDTIIINVAEYTM